MAGTMINVVLVEPEIPPNAGNIVRTCAATGVPLHLIEPLGFSLEDRYLRRAGLDYWPDVDLTVHPSFPVFLEREQPTRLAALSTRGEVPYTQMAATDGTYLLFGPESRGLAPTLLEQLQPDVYRIPMRRNQRSLNLSNAVAVVVYALLAARGFEGLT